MNSLRTKITMLIIGMVIIAVTTVTLLSMLFFTRDENRESGQLMVLLCQTGARNLNYYFDSVQSSVGKVAGYVDADLDRVDLDGRDNGQLEEHVNRVRKYFNDMANNTDGVLTYYYRIDPAASKTVKGFWYTNLDRTAFKEHEVTDITLYDTKDTTKLVWFTVPKFTGKPVWLPPYITDNLDVRVISYNVPISWKGRFIGVAGIELDYSALAAMIQSIKLYDNGYAFVTDAKGNLVFHPRIDVTKLTPKTTPDIPKGLRSDSGLFQYRFNGVDKKAVSLPLINGMRLYVTAPVSEAEGDWQKLMRQILVVSVIVLLALGAFTLYYVGHITKPLEQLIRAAEQVSEGNFDFTLENRRDDEIGKLTETFMQLASHVKEHITDLNRRIYVDALTSVKNKGAFTKAVEDLQEEVKKDPARGEFAIGLFDCNDLKHINDRYGHEKGDIYLKTASRLICRVFQHSPVFRIGGDEFVVILRNEDFLNRDLLLDKFARDSAAICAATGNRWEWADVAVGVAVYDPEVDKSVNDTVQRADQIMYGNKHAIKEERSDADRSMWF